MIDPVYIAAPFNGPTAEAIRENVARAGLLARLAVLEGLAPILVHTSIPLLYGEETPANLEIGLARNVAIVKLVARTYTGQLWVLQNPDGTLSSGVRREVNEWLKLRSSLGSYLRSTTWDGWAPLAHRHGMGEQWRAHDDGLVDRLRGAGL